MRDVWTVTTLQDGMYDVKKFFEEQEARDEYEHEKENDRAGIIILSKVLEGFVR